jgi:MFS family permease
MAGFDFHLPQSLRAGLGHSRHLHDIPEISEELDFELQPTGRVESQESGIDVVELIANLEDSELDFSEDFSSRFPRPGGPLDDVLQDFQLPSSDELFPDDTLPDLVVPEREQYAEEVSPRTSVIHHPTNPAHDLQLDFSFALPRDSINAAALRDFHFRHSDNSSSYTSQGTESGHYHYPVQETDHDSVLDEVHDPSQVETKDGDEQVEQGDAQAQLQDQGDEPEERFHQFIRFENLRDSQDTQRHVEGDIDDQGREEITVRHHAEDSQESVYSQSVACRLSRDISETSETVCASPRSPQPSESLQPPENKAYQDFDWIEGTCYRGSIQPTYRSIFANDQPSPPSNPTSRKVFSADVAPNRKTWLVLPEAPPVLVCDVTGWRDSRETLCSFYQEYFDDDTARDNVPMSIDAVLDIKDVSLVSCEEIAIVDTTLDRVIERPITIIGKFTIAEEFNARPSELQDAVATRSVHSIILEEPSTTPSEVKVVPEVTILEKESARLSSDVAVYPRNDFSSFYEITPSIKELASFIHDAAVLGESSTISDAVQAKDRRGSATLSAMFNDAALFGSAVVVTTVEADRIEPHTAIIPETANIPLVVPVVDVPKEEKDECFTISSPSSPPSAVSSPTPTSPILPSFYLPQRSLSQPKSSPLPPSPPPPPSSPPPPSPSPVRLAPPTRAPPLPPALPAPPVLLTPSSPLPSPEPSNFSSFDALDARQLSQPSPPLSLYSTSSSQQNRSGGFPAWLQVLSASLLFLNTWGLFSAFGTFQAYYSVILLPSTSSAFITLIGTLSGFLLCAVPLACLLLFRSNTTFHLPIRTLVLTGTLLITLGLLLSSLSTTLWHLLITQGLCCGLGGGCLFSVAMEILLSTSASFARARQQRRRALALGLAMVGAAVGGIIYPLVFRGLLPQLGFAWAVRAVAIVALCTLVVPCVVVIYGRRAAPQNALTTPPKEQQQQSEKVSPITTPLPTLLTNRSTILTFNLVVLLLSAAVLIPHFQIESFASHRGMPFSASMLPLINFGSLPGLLIPFLLTLNNNLDSIHPLYILACPASAGALLAFLWSAIPPHAAALLAVWCVCYGFCVGAGTGLLAVVIGEMTPSPASSSSSSPHSSASSQTSASPSAANLQSILTLLPAGLGLLLGGPISSLLIAHQSVSEASSGKFLSAQILCGILFTCGALAVLITTTLIPRGELARMTRHRNRTKRGRSPTLEGRRVVPSSSSMMMREDVPKILVAVAEEEEDDEGRGLGLRDGINEIATVDGHGMKGNERQSQHHQQRLQRDDETAGGSLVVEKSNDNDDEMRFMQKPGKEI